MEKSMVGATMVFLVTRHADLQCCTQREGMSMNQAAVYTS